MAWLYHQATGEILHDGIAMGAGYSGHSYGKNRPSLEAHAGIGPIPVGLYKIGTAFDHPHLGPCVMHLSPDGHNALGRLGFFIHGDSGAHPGQASHGCIVLGPHLRNLIATSRDHVLDVVK